jgi:hypothetical protein
VIARLLLAAVLCLAGCGRDDDAPVMAARAFAHAAQRGDVRTLLELIERRAVEHLEAAAEQASDQIGGRRSIATEEMLQVVEIDPTFQIARTERLDDDEEITRVKLVGADESEHVLVLVHEEGAWRVRIPLQGPAAAR